MLRCSLLFYMWYYKDKCIRSRDDLPKEAVGFVYKIVHKKEHLYYIGKKILLNKRTRKPLKGYKRKRVDYIESNWMTYTGSNSVSKNWNTDDCFREIIYVCYNRTMMTYQETMLQFKENVLEDVFSLNDNILGKFFKERIIKYRQEQDDGK